MRPCAKAVITGMLGLALAACVAPPPPSSPALAQAQGFKGRTQIAAICNTRSFLSKVAYLDTSTGFRLPDSGFGRTPPFLDPNSMPVAQIVLDDLGAAFDEAPPFFKAKLCDLDGVYIDPTGCSGHTPSSCAGLSDQQISDSSWAFRAWDSPGRVLGEYVGLSLGLWKTGGHAPSFSNFETRRLQSLLSWTSAKPPVHGFTKPDLPATTVLAALAHGVGHILWYDVFVINERGDPNPGGEADFSRFCGGTFYKSAEPGQGSWQNVDVGLPPKRWVSFGATRNSHKADDIDLAQLGFSLNRKDYPNAGDLLHGIYSGELPTGGNAQNGRWASVLAAFSPDEDFVETFQLYVLINAKSKLENSQVRIYGRRADPFFDDIPANLDRKPELIRKLNCFKNFFP